MHRTSFARDARRWSAGSLAAALALLGAPAAFGSDHITADRSAGGQGHEIRDRAKTRRRRRTGDGRRAGRPVPCASGPAIGARAARGGSATSSADCARAGIGLDASTGGSARVRAPRCSRFRSRTACAPPARPTRGRSPRCARAYSEPPRS
jgi:hypothetical protein